MPFTNGNKEPSYGEFSNIRTGELDQLKKSGMFEVEIVNANYYHGTVKSTGNEYHQAALDCAVIYQGNPVKAVRFSIFLPSREMEALCYFLNLRDAEGNLSMPDPTHREGTSKSGKEYKMDTFPFLSGKRVHAILDFTGENMGGNGVMYSMFDLKGFCDEKGRSAVEACHNAPAAEHFRQTILDLKAKNAQGTIPGAAPAAPAPAPAAGPDPFGDDAIPF